MIRITEQAVQWLWVDATTGICFPETMAGTEDWARSQAERILGKRRITGFGEVKAVRVTLTPLTEAETKAHREEFEAWQAKKAAERKGAS